MEMLRLFYVIPLSLEKFKIEDFSFFFFQKWIKEKVGKYRDNILKDIYISLKIIREIN